jgi:hypothetical protein
MLSFRLKTLSRQTLRFSLLTLPILSTCLAHTQGALHQIESLEELNKDFSSSSNQNSKEEKNNSVINQDAEKIKQLSASTIAFWALARGESPSSKLQRFKKNLTKSSQWNPRYLKILKEKSSPENSSKKSLARQKFLNFISSFQESFPAIAPYLPEILVSWGEARFLSGFFAGDLLFQQAKIASVLHVVRNRHQKLCLSKKVDCSPLNEGFLKMKLIAKRYQFSAFEPYDPNFLEIIMGSRKTKVLGSVADLPPYDARSLENIIATIVKMERNLIKLSSPLSNLNTRHYITPVLKTFDAKKSASVQKKYLKSYTHAFLLVPEQKPTHYAIVPIWARQNSLISSPQVEVADFDSDRMTEQIIPPDDFIFFSGLQ